MKSSRDLQPSGICCGVELNREILKFEKNPFSEMRILSNREYTSLNECHRRGGR
jgi:hypothetical protein